MSHGHVRAEELLVRHRRGKQTVVPCDTDSFAVQNKGPAEVAQVACV